MTTYIKYFFLLILLFAAISSQPAYAQQTDSLSYDILFGDRHAGFAHIWNNDDQTYQSIFEFNDRGRGPHLEESIQLSASGLILKHTVEGHNYFKEPVKELFEVKGGRARWESSIENGSAPFDGDRFYISVQGILGNQLLVSKLLNTSSRSLSLLPEGNAQIPTVTDHTIGENLQLKLITVTGLDFAPQYFWVDNQNRVFASINSWFSIIREEHVELQDTLRTLQEQEIDHYYRDLADRMTHEPEQPVAIKNVTLFDSGTATMKPSQTVLIEGDRIIQAGDTESITIPNSAQVIDGTGKTLLPGLFDMHTHGDKLDGLLHLAAGVTSIRDMANALDFPEIKEKFNSNALIGPRVVTMSGFVDQAGPYAGPTGKIVKTLEEGLEGVQYYHDRGYQQIKLYSSIDPAWVEPLTEKAHDLGMRVSGHIPAYMLAEEAVRAGYDEIQHINMIVLNFLPDTLDTRTPVRFSEVAKHAHKIDLNGKEFQEFLQLLKTNDTVVDPTVSIFEGMFTTRPGQPDPSFEMVLNRLPVQVRRGFYSGGLPVEDNLGDDYKASYQKMLGMVHALYESGITIVPGTDALAGFGLHRELENYVRAGIPANEVLKIATLTSAEVAGMSDRIGSIEEGKIADLILVDGNPAENISDIRKVELTIKDGNLYKPEELYPALGVTPSN